MVIVNIVNKKIMHMAVTSKMTIAKEPFHAVIAVEGNDLHVAATWLNKFHHAFHLRKMSDAFGIALPSFLNWEIVVKEVMLDYYSKPHKVCLYIVTERGQKLILAADMDTGIYSFRMDLNLQYKLHTLPIIGKYAHKSDILGISFMQANYTHEGIDLQYKLLCNLAGYELPSFNKESKEPMQCVEEPIRDVVPKQKDSVHWMIINKTIGPCYIRRIGGTFQDGKIAILLDAGIKISILQLDFLELSVQMALAQDFLFDYGLKGLVVNIQKAPLCITGGLYTVKKGELYNGMVAICYEKFSFLGLGSYGIIKKTNESSVFMYMLVNYPFGGPPCFYITGIAAGIGVNRKIHLPTLEKVSEFPFIAMACGNKIEGETIASDTSPAVVLEKMSDAIEVSNGSSFITAGIRFTSFGMLETIMVANIDFGARLEISLLGLSTMSLPPQSPSPIAYGKLALRAVYCPDDGILQIEGALYKDAFIFSHDCHVCGGFAFYSWFKGEHKGDFVLSVGGYHPKFDRKHYPNVERISVNWNIMKGLTLQGEAYFALTPNCIMAGGILNLDYRWGKLKAWCHALANFMIAWKPFHYDIEIGVRIGISYRLDCLFIHHTFITELSAYLHLWGPEFAGIVHVKWYIISFTITFNTNAEQPHNTLTWNDFTQAFLPNFHNGIIGYQEVGQKLAQVQISFGKISEKNLLFPTRAKIAKVCFVDSNKFEISIQAALPLTVMRVGDKEFINKQPFGILPMGVKRISAELEVTCYQVTACRNDYKKVAIKFDSEAYLQNLPKALWGTTTPDITENMLKDMLMGCSLKGTIEKGDILPGEQHWYSLAQLLKNEEYHCKVHYRWMRVVEVITPHDYGDIKNAFLNNTKRAGWLQQLKAYGIRQENEISMVNFSKYKDELLQSPLVLRKTSATLEMI